MKESGVWYFKLTKFLLLFELEDFLQGFLGNISNESLYLKEINPSSKFRIMRNRVKKVI